MNQINLTVLRSTYIFCFLEEIMLNIKLCAISDVQYQNSAYIYLHTYMYLQFNKDYIMDLYDNCRALCTLNLSLLSP